MTNRKETANPNSEKMTTVARVIGLKGMPIGKRLWGHFSNLETTETPEKKGISK